MEVDNGASAAAAATSTAVAVAAAPALSRRVPLCSYAPPSLAGAPTASLSRGKTVLDSAAEKLGDWGSGFGGWLVSNDSGDGDEEDDEEENKRRRQRSAAASCSFSPSSLTDLSPFRGTLPLPSAQRQSTHELAGQGLKASVAARDAAFYAEYSLFLSETKGGGSGGSGARGLTTTITTTTTTASQALLTRESVVSGRRVPLAKLFRVVQRLGGYAKVAEGKRAWRDVLRAFEVRERVFFFFFVFSFFRFFVFSVFSFFPFFEKEKEKNRRKREGKKKRL